MNKIDKDYQNLVREIINTGHEKGDRTGTGTVSIFSNQLKINMADGFPLLTTKKMFSKGIIKELLWFLDGGTNIRPLVLDGVNIWNGDAYKKYLEYPLATMQNQNTNKLYHNLDRGWCMMIGRSVMSPHPTRHLTLEEFVEKIKEDELFAREFGELGPIYGKQWVDISNGNRVDPETGIFLGYEQINQIQNLIDLLKTNPDSRRMIVSAWNVSELDEMTLPPCHWAFEVYTRELLYEERYYQWFKNNYETGMEYDDDKEIDFDDDHWVPTPTRAISLKWHQRSVDVGLGLPFNIASYALLLEMLGQQVNMVPETLIGDLTNVHIYKNHVDIIKTQLDKEAKRLPILKLKKAKDIFSYSYDDFEIEGYESHERISMPLSN